MRGLDLRGVHRVRRRLASGAVRERHYAWRGGPCFWHSDMPFKPGTPAYLAALAATVAPADAGELSVPQLIDRFLDSAEFRGLATRTKADYRLWALRLSTEFADDPARILEDPGSRREVAEWRARWAHAPKSFDYAGTVAARIASWAVDNGLLKAHFLHRLAKAYRPDRAGITWTAGDIARFDAVAPPWVRRVLAVACETGLRPADLVRLSLDDVEETPGGLRLRVKTAKRGRIAHIPALEATVAAVAAARAAGHDRLLVNARGAPLSERAASDAVRYWRDKAGLSDELHLYDARGTAATRLLRAGLALNDIATCMGWSLRYAGNVIEAYARVAPDETDRIRRALTGDGGA